VAVSWRIPGALVCLHRTEDSVQFVGQVFDLLLERDGGDLFVLVVLLSRLVSILVEIHVLMLFRCGRCRSGLLRPAITELEVKIYLFRKIDF
jgi:hypothetical protein